jgi:4-hydroxybenzoyl-CoA thioesterase
MLTNRKTIRVEWGDCDPAGIVYYPRYFAYFDNCTAALFEAAGLPKHKMLKAYGIVGIPMVDTRARFLAPSRFGDDVIVECSETRVWAVRSTADPDAIEGHAVPQDVIARFGAPQIS